MPRKRTDSPRLPCEICGASIPRKPGMPAKTCGAECAAERNRRKERARYYQVKDTPEWKSTRAEYIKRIKDRLDSDPEYAALFRAYSNERVRKWRKKIGDSPEHQDYRERVATEKRNERAAWRRQLLEDPMAWEVHKFKARAWYAGLSAADRERIFYAPARRRTEGRKKENESG